VLLRALQQPTAAYQHLIDVLDSDANPETAASARAALDEITTRQKFRVRSMTR
jgi:hypothetical protein